MFWKYIEQGSDFSNLKLTLRSKLSGMEFPQSSEGRLDGAQIQFGLECKVIEFGVAFE